MSSALQHVPNHDRKTLFLMSGAGNLFSVLAADSLDAPSFHHTEHVRELCAPNELFRQGTEGLLIVGPSSDHTLDFAVDFFNPDGSSSMMCGNGARCALRFAIDHHIVPEHASSYRFSMAGAHYEGKAVGDLIDIRFDAPRELLLNQELEFEGRSVRYSYCNVGSDHIVLDEIEFRRLQQALDMQELLILAGLRRHPSFHRGTNVNIIAPTADSTDDAPRLMLRTYERGVEAITGACGTGALASALVYRETHATHCTKVILIPPSAEELVVDFECDVQNRLSALHLCGPAVECGEVVIPE